VREIRPSYCADFVGPADSEFADKVGYDLAGVTYAVLALVFYIPVIVVIFRGKTIREKFGAPTYNQGS
jgi:chromate transport protein ChrA